MVLAVMKTLTWGKSSDVMCFGTTRVQYDDQPPVLAVLGSVLVPLLRTFSGTGLRTRFVPSDLFRTSGCRIGPTPTCPLFSHFRSPSGAIPVGTTCTTTIPSDIDTITHPKPPSTPLLSSTLTFSIPTSASVLPRATSYSGPIDSHDHYVSRPSRFRAATSRCRSLLPNLAIRFPRLIRFATFGSPELNPVPLSPSELSDSVRYRSPSSIEPPFV